MLLSHCVGGDRSLDMLGKEACCAYCEMPSVSVNACAWDHFNREVSRSGRLHFIVFIYLSEPFNYWNTMQTIGFSYCFIL